jgi:hypothetical protein
MMLQGFLLFNSTLTVGTNDTVLSTPASTYNELAAGIASVLETALGNGTTVYVDSITDPFSVVSEKSDGGGWLSHLSPTYIHTYTFAHRPCKT